MSKKKFSKKQKKQNNNDVSIQKVEKTTGSKDERAVVWRHQRASKQIIKHRAVNGKTSTAFLGDPGENLS